MLNTTPLYRQINPNWVQNGRVMSMAFKPTPKDEHKLSVYHGEMFTAEDSYRHFTQRGFKSRGVMHVTAQECTEHQFPVEEDFQEFQGHMVIVFDENLSNNGLAKRAKELTELAVSHGWDYECC